MGYAIERKQQGIVVANELSWEMKKFYNAEFQVGLKALDIVKQELDVELPEDEAGFIAMHLVNAQMGGQMNQSQEYAGNDKGYTQYSQIYLSGGIG